MATQALLPVLSLFVCLSVLICQIVAVICYWKKYSNTRDTLFIIICVIICFSSNTLQSLVGILLSTPRLSCNICKWAPLTSQCLYTTTRLFVYLFYLQRARLAQSFNPIIRRIYFTKIFPSIFSIIYVLFILFVIFKAGNQSECTLQKCFISPADNGYFLNIGALMEIFVCVFFGYLFVSPLVSIIHSNEKVLKLEYSQSNATTNRRLSIFDSFKYSISPSSSYWKSTAYINTPSVHKYPFYTNSPRDTRYTQNVDLKRALFYNVLLSIVSLMASVLTMVVWSRSPTKFHFIPYIDYMINSISPFLMLGRNRKFVWRIFVKLFGNAYCCSLPHEESMQSQRNERIYLNHAMNVGHITPLKIQPLKEQIERSECISDSDDSILSATEEDLYAQQQRKILHHFTNYQSTDNRL